MLFPTVTFAIFFVVVFTVNWLIRRWVLPWKLFLFGASLVFYGWWDARFVALVGISILANYLFAIAIQRAKGDAQSWTRAARWTAGGAVVVNLALLGWFKYYGFFVTSVTNSLTDVGIHIDPPLLEITLPVGISFFTFHAISYVVDVGRGNFRPMSLLDFGLYITFFPHLVAGPIVRATELGPQIENPDPNPRIPTSEAFRLIFAGLFKKVVVSSYLASEIVDPAFSLPNEHSSLELLFATYAYAIVIYADFSGYTDIAIGCALLLGFRLPQNFDQPYRAVSMQDFWRRWHMTLSRWLRDYLYIPLGGSRGGSLFTYRNLMITMLLGGLWHGAAWNFVVWGALLGTVLVIERLVRDIGLAGPLARLLPGRRGSTIHWVLTFHLVCLSWIFFRAETFEIATTIIGRIFTAWGDAPLVTPMVVFTIAGMLALQFWPPRFTIRLQEQFGRLPALPQAATLGVGLFMIERLGPEGVAPFIYFQF